MRRTLTRKRSFFKVLWAGRISRVLLLTACMLLIAAVVVAVCLFDEGVSAGQNAQKLAEAYDKAVSVQPAISDESPETSEEPDETTRPDATPVTIDGYQVMGKIQIPKIEAALPVIAYTDEEALKVSVCYFQGPMPDERGDLVITGHNYASGAHFGRLDELETGDDVTLSMPDGSVYRYVVAKKQRIKPDDTEALNNYEGDHVLTLLTCTSHGNERLLVRCDLEG